MYRYLLFKRAGIRLLFYWQLKYLDHSGDIWHMQRTQTATLQSFHSNVNHHNTEKGGRAMMEKFMEEGAQVCGLSDSLWSI